MPSSWCGSHWISTDKKMFAFAVFLLAYGHFSSDRYFFLCVVKPGKGIKIWRRMLKKWSNMIKKPLIRKFAFKNSIVFCCCNIYKNESMWFISLKCDSPLMTADWLWNRLKCMGKEVNEHTVSHAYLDMNLSCAVHWHPILGSDISKWTLVSMVHCSLWTKQRKMKKNKSCSTRLKSKSRLDVWRDTFNTFARFFHLRKMCVLPPFFISFHTIPAIELVCVTSK